jgi:hypothetical protein
MGALTPLSMLSEWDLSNNVFKINVFALRSPIRSSQSVLYGGFKV